MKPSPSSWVIGEGGLLGSALAAALGSPVFRPAAPLGWNEPALEDRLRTALEGFAELVKSRAEPWQICWCAGAGVVGTSADALSRETEALGSLLDLVCAQPLLRASRGTFLLASSAGGVHAGEVGVISESSAPCPTSDYGRAKLRQEQLMLSRLESLPGISTLTARLTNLYGPAQKLGKPQGLISHLSRSLIFDTPVQIYVSLDTLRDYFYGADAGRLLAAGLARLQRMERPAHVVKLYGSERDTSISALLGIFRNISKRPIRVITGLRITSAQQPRRLSFRSNVWPEDARLPRTELLSGVSRVYQAQLALLRAGKLARPAIGASPHSMMRDRAPRAMSK